MPRGNGPRDRPRGGKEAARTVLSVFRKMMNWGIREELLTRKDNPAEGMEANLPKKRRRERVLSREECQVAWVASGTLGYPFGPIYRLLFVTGTRESEWGRAVRDWIDLPQALSVIPADSFKSDHVHVVPLVPVAVQTKEYVYARHPTRSGKYIFSGTDGRRPLGGWSKAQDRLMRAMCSVTGERAVKDPRHPYAAEWRAHRRFATICNSLRHRSRCSLQGGFRGLRAWARWHSNIPGPPLHEQPGTSSGGSPMRWWSGDEMSVRTHLILYPTTGVPSSH